MRQWQLKMFNYKHYSPRALLLGFANELGFSIAASVTKYNSKVFQPTAMSKSTIHKTAPSAYSLFTT